MTDIKRTQKEGKLALYGYETDRFKCENISIYFSVPSNREDSVARSLLLSVLKRGTEKYPSQMAINERLDELYATLVSLKNQKFDNRQLLGITADVINSAYTENGEDLLPDVLDMISQMLFHPAFDKETGLFNEEYVLSEKENYKSIILSQINEPRTYAAIRCREEMFSSLGIIEKLDGMCEKIDSVTNEHLVRCYREIVNNAPIIVFYVGSRPLENVAQQIESVFPYRSVQIMPGSKKAPLLLEYTDEPNLVNESKSISQSRLVVGYNCRVTWRDDDYYAMLLCNEILGASPISKLMTNVREKMSLCYECSSVYNSARGAIFVTTGIDGENYEKAKKAINKQLSDIQKGKISKTEFLAAKKSILNVYSGVKDSASAIERFYLGRIVNGIDMDISGFIQKIESLTVEDVINVSKLLCEHTIYFLSGNGGGEDELYE